MATTRSKTSSQTQPQTLDEALANVQEVPSPETPAKPKWSKEDLLSIFDEIMFNTEYVEQVIIKGRLKVKFKSRSAKDTSEISEDLDGRNYNLVATLQERRALLNVVYSLVEYNGKSLRDLAFSDREKYVSNLPAVIIASISQALVDFDLKVTEACKEGEENF